VPPLPGAYRKATQRLRRDVVGRFPRGVWALTVIHLFTSAGFSICLPFLPLYLHQERDLSMTLVGTLFLLSGTISAGTQMVGGVLADRIGRRRLLLTASVARMFLYSGLATLIGLAAPVWAILIPYVAGQAVGMAMRPAMTAMVADLSPEDRLTESYALLRVGQNVGWAAGPAVGGYLIGFLPYAWLFGVAAFSTVVTFALILVFLSESFAGTAETVRFRSIFTVAGDRTFVMYTGLSLLVFLSMGQLGATLSVFSVDRIGLSTAQYGLLLMVNGIIVVLFQYPVARWAGRLPRAWGLVLGSLFYAVGWLSMGGVMGFSGAVAAIAVVTIGEIVFTPLTLAMVGRLSPWDRRGRYMGFFGLSQSLSMSLGPLVGGSLLDAFPLNPWAIWGTISAIPFAAAIGLQRWGATRLQRSLKTENAQP
jgi:MFS family permease